jgi:hypothetical protein
MFEPAGLRYVAYMRIVLVLALVACVAPTAPMIAPVAPPVVARQVAPHYAFASASDAEHRLFAAINDARATAGLAPLAWNDQVSFVAHAQSADQPFDFGTLTLNNLSIESAKGDTVDAAAQAWLNDEKVSAKFLSAYVTQIGIAVVETAGTMTATAIVFRTPSSIDTDALASHVAGVLESRERRRDTDLRSIAQTAAMELAAGTQRRDVLPMIQSRLRGFDRKWTNIHQSMTRLDDLHDLDSDDVLAKKLLNAETVPSAEDVDLGVGVAQGAHPEAGDGAIWIVVLYAEIPAQEVSRPPGGYAF